MRWLTLAFFGALLILAAAPALGPIAFEELADRAGIHFVADNSPTANKNLPETMLAGVALFDYDNDGYLDIYFVNGAAIPSLKKESPKYWNRLFHNNHDGTFTDVTEKAGVNGEGYGIGVAIGDYDNDGWPDIDRKSTRLNSSHLGISYAVFCLKKKKTTTTTQISTTTNPTVQPLTK